MYLVIIEDTHKKNWSELEPKIFIFFNIKKLFNKLQLFIENKYEIQLNENQINLIIQKTGLIIASNPKIQIRIIKININKYNKKINFNSSKNWKLDDVPIIKTVQKEFCEGAYYVKEFQYPQ